jgi:hypothetical protein
MFETSMSSKGEAPELSLMRSIKKSSHLRLFDYLTLGLILLVGALLRLDIIRQNPFSLDADEAIVGLMAKHILEGQGIPIFYYGQHYMGSFEALLASISFYLLGMTPLALKLVPFVFSLILVVLIGAITHVLVPSTLKKSALYAAFLLGAVPPAALVAWSTMARGGFMEILVLGATAFLSAILWIQAVRADWGRTFFIGTVLGFGWWTNNQIIFFMGPIGLFMLLRSVYRDSLAETVGHVFWGILAFFLGGLPFWLYNFQHDFASFGLFGSSSQIGRNFSGLWTTALPMIGGARHFWHTEDIFPGATLVILAIYLVCLVTFFISRWQVIQQIFRGQVSAESPIEILLVFLVTTGAIFVVSSFGFLVSAPRYLLPLYIGLFPLIGFVVAAHPRLGKVLLAALVSIHIYSLYGNRGAFAGEPLVFRGERVQRDHRELIKWISAQGITYLRTNYWIGYRLAFETQEKVLFSVFGEPYQIRLPYYERVPKGMNPREVPFLLTPSQADVVVKGLEALGYQFDRVDLRGYSILTNLREPVRTLEALPLHTVRLHSSHHQSALSHLIDGDLATRWGSASPQQEGMWIELHFNEPILMDGLDYQLGQWQSDFPRSLEITCIRGSSRVSLLSREGYAAMRYVTTGSEQTAAFLHLAFAPHQCDSLRLEQSGHHPILDWSVAELAITGRKL